MSDALKGNSSSNHQSALSDWAQRTRANRSAEISEQMSGSYELDNIERNLLRYEKATTASVPVEHFRNVFLPFFCGEEDKNIYRVNLLHWSGVAGGWYRSVNLVDSTGDVVLVVPPVWDNSALTAKGGDRRSSTQQAIVESDELAISRPRQAQSFMRNYYAQELNRMAIKPLDLEHLIAWNKIFRYFDKPLIEIPGFDLIKYEQDRDREKVKKEGGVTSNETVTTTGPSDDYESEDF